MLQKDFYRLVNVDEYEDSKQKSELQDSFTVNGCIIRMMILFISIYNKIAFTQETFY